MRNCPHHLQENEREAIGAVIDMLSHLMSDNLVGLYLFGSKARGDFHADSDIDLLVIVKELDADSRWNVRATAADFSLQHDVLFNTHIIDKIGWDKLAQFNGVLWREVQRDGISLYELAAQPITS